MAEDFVKQLFDFVNVSVDRHLESADNLKDFLRFVAGFRSGISTGNKILTYGYNPSATDIRTKEAWEKLGFGINDESAVIYNIRQNPDGSYSERVMYDVSVTDEIPVPYEQFPNAGFFAERLIMYAPCPIKYREGQLKDNRKACYDPEKGIIEVTHGFKDEEQACHGLLREFAHFYLHENEIQQGKKTSKTTKGVQYNRDKHGVEAQAVSYAICVRYGINPPDIDVLSPPEGSSEDRRKVLEGLDRSVWKISQRIEEGGKQQRRFADNSTDSFGQEHSRGQPEQGRG